MKTEADEPINPTGDHNMMQPSYGMTLRQYFAGLAMQGYRANDAYSESQPETIASLSVRDADALITELNK